MGYQACPCAVCPMLAQDNCWTLTWHSYASHWLANQLVSYYRDVYAGINGMVSHQMNCASQGAAIMHSWTAIATRSMHRSVLLQTLHWVPPLPPATHLVIHIKGHVKKHQHAKCTLWQCMITTLYMQYSTQYMGITCICACIMNDTHNDFMCSVAMHMRNVAPTMLCAWWYDFVHAAMCTCAQNCKLLITNGTCFLLPIFCY